MKLDHAERFFVFCAIISLVALLAGPALAGQDTVLTDRWAVMRMAGDEVGWIHEKTTRIEKDGKILYKSETSTEMGLKRFGQSVSIAMEGWALEDDKGKILSMHQKSSLSGQATLFDLEVKEGQGFLTTTTVGTPYESVIDWDQEALGPWGIMQHRKNMGAAKGTGYSYKTFSFDYIRIFTTSVEVQEKQTVQMLDDKTADGIHVVSTTDILPGVKINEWWNEDLETIKMSMKMMGLAMETFRTGKDRALSSKGGELKADMIIETMATAHINLPAPYRLDSILYHFKAKDPELGLPKDLDRFNQKVIEGNDQEAKVLISAVAPEESQIRPLGNPTPELFEYLESNAFLQSDDPGIQAKALEVVGDETDAWKAACLLEKFVFEHIKEKNFGTGFASAAEVLEDGCGDCSEHGVLLAALCRAAGIPARVAMGYMYLGGIFGGHMWVEVWIKDNWYPIDGVMGIGRVDPTHITFCVSSLKDGGLGQAFASAVQGLGNLDLEILEITRDGKTTVFGERFKDYIIDGTTYTNTLYGISITCPDGFEFENYERDFTGVDFTLVEMTGESDSELTALPAIFSFNMDAFKERLTQAGTEIVTELKRKVCDETATVFMLQDKDGHMIRVLAVIHEDTCFSLKMRIQNDERDLQAFEKMVNSIRFSR